MKSTSAVLLAALALTAVTIMPAAGGSMGNGAAQRNAAYHQSARQTAQYVFCYGGNPKVVYFTGVFSVPPGVEAGELDVRYRHYVQTTYGVPSIDRDRCVTANTAADATAEKQRYREMSGRENIIETAWTGG